MYAEACITRPRNSPGMSGFRGSQLCPLATITAAYRDVRDEPPPVDWVVTSQPPSSVGAAETTSMPNQMCSPSRKCAE